MQIHLIAAARPNFMKIAPLYHALKSEQWVDPIIVHSGQHYDLNMSDAFFKDLRLPEPDIHLSVGSGSHAEQTAKVMISYEKIILERRPDIIIVVGDVNTTLGCALAASKINFNKNGNNTQDRPFIVHLEAGLRSFDRSMPEEINRILTDSLSDLLLTPSPDGDENLIKEGIGKEKIVRVGNIMIDSLEMMRATIEIQKAYTEYDLNKGGYGVVTFHRPVNVDRFDNLSSICTSLIDISKRTPLVFPVHPRTRRNLEQYGLMDKMRACDTIVIIEPLNYVRFMSLIFNCRFTITDSGGIQEETTYLGIPCLTVRKNTERPITLTQGTNQLCDIDNLKSLVEITIMEGVVKRSPLDLWDGKTAFRVVDAIKKGVYRTIKI